MNLTGNFDKLMQGDDFDADKSEAVVSYGNASQVRNICFVQTDGNALFISYSNLVSGEIGVEKDTIVLRFAYYTITLKGENMAKLFSGLQGHMVWQITVSSKRYNVLHKTNDPCVTEITIERNF